MTSHSGLAHDIEADADPRRPPDPTERDGLDEPTGDAEDASVEDWIEADKSRPTLPEETADGLDDTDEEIRRQAEDRPLATPGDDE